MMRDDIEQARRAGYTDEQILSVLTEDTAQRAEIDGAIKRGYTPAQVISVFQDEAGQAKRDTVANQSWADYGADLLRAPLYGAGAEAMAVGTALSRPADKTAPNGLVNTAGDALQAGGALAQAQATGYRPAQFDITHPVATASELPKAALEAAPGLGATLLAGAGAGAVGGAVAGPVGATIGAIGGAGAYALTRYWGQNAQGHAETQGRAKPTQADFDATLGESAAMAGVDVATLKAGGLLTKSAKGGLTAKAAEAAKTSASLAGGGAVNSVIGQTAAMDETKPGQDSLTGRLGQVDYEDAANAGATGAAVGGLVRGIKIPAEIAGAVKYRAGGPINEQALKRVSDYINSDSFPGDPQNRSQTGATLRMAGEHYRGNLDTFAKNADELGLSPDARTTLDQTSRYLKSGAVYDEAQLARIQEAVGDQTVFRALADQNAVNWIHGKAGRGQDRSTGERVLGAALRNPGKAGAIGGALSEGLPLLTGGLNIATGGKLLASAMAAKALSKATGIDAVINDPLGSIANRYGTKAANDPTAVTPFGTRTLDDYRALNEARTAFNEPAQPSAPSAPPAANGNVPPPVAPAQPSLADALGIAPEPRFAPAANSNAPAPAPVAPAGPRPMMGTQDILGEIRLQAEGERRPLIEVAQEHHRSARSMGTNMGYPEAIRDLFGAQAKAIHTDLIAPFEAEYGGKADPMVARSRSFKQVEQAPAPEFTISNDGAALLSADMPTVARSVAAAPSEGAARRAVEDFIGRFGVRDRDFVRATLAASPAFAKAGRARKLNATAKAGTVLKRAKTKASSRK